MAMPSSTNINYTYYDAAHMYKKSSNVTIFLKLQPYTQERRTPAKHMPGTVMTQAMLPMDMRFTSPKRAAPKRKKTEGADLVKSFQLSRTLSLQLVST